MNGKAWVGVLVGATVSVGAITATLALSSQPQDAAQAAEASKTSQAQSAPDEQAVFEARGIVLGAIAASGIDRQGSQAAMTDDGELTLYWSGDQPSWLADAVAAAEAETNVAVILVEVTATEADLKSAATELVALAPTGSVTSIDFGPDKLTINGPRISNSESASKWAAFSACVEELRSAGLTVVLNETQESYTTSVGKLRHQG